MKQIFKRVSGKVGASETLRAGGSAGILVSVKVLGTLGTFLYTVLMARMMTPQEFGTVWTLWSAVFIASYVSTLNIGAGAIREIVRARIENDTATIAGFVTVSRRILMIMTVPVIAAFVGVIWWRNPEVMAEYPLAVLLAAATIPIMGWNQSNSLQAMAMDKVLRSQLPTVTLRPIIFLLVLGVVWLVGGQAGLTMVIGIYLAVTLAVAFAQYRLVWRFFTFLKDAVPDTRSQRRWIINGLILSPGRLLTNNLRSVFILVASVPLGAAGVAQMTVALSIVNFMNFAMTAVETSFSPKTSRALNRDIVDGVAPAKMRRPNHFLAVSGLLKLGLVAFGSLVLWLVMPILIGMFGPEYAISATVAWIFMLNPLANALFGNSPLVMQIFDRRFDIMLCSIIALIALPVAGMVIAPLLIAQGSDPLMTTAGALVAVMVGLHVLRWGLCLWRTGVDTSTLGALVRRQRLRASQ